MIQQGDQWLAQALDVNLAAQGSSDKQAIGSFMRILRARLHRDFQNGRAPLSGLPPAPDRFWDAWEKAQVENDHFVTQQVSTTADGSSEEISTSYLALGTP